jgi:hypothetical protein
MRARRPLTIALVTLAALGARGRRARAEALPVLAGRIDAVATAGDGVAVLRGGEALLLDGAGRLMAAARA